MLKVSAKLSVCWSLISRIVGGYLKLCVVRFFLEETSGYTDIIYLQDIAHFTVVEGKATTYLKRESFYDSLVFLIIFLLSYILAKRTIDNARHQKLMIVKQAESKMQNKRLQLKIKRKIRKSFAAFTSILLIKFLRIKWASTNSPTMF